MKNLFFLLLLFLALLTAPGCGDDDENGGGNEPAICTATVYSEQTSVAFMSFSEAVNAYAADPSTANCEAYRDAANDYLDALARFESCTFLVDNADYQESLREAREEVAGIECN